MSDILEYYLHILMHFNFERILTNQEIIISTNALIKIEKMITFLIDFYFSLPFLLFKNLDNRKITYIF